MYRSRGFQYSVNLIFVMKYLLDETQWRSQKKNSEGQPLRVTIIKKTLSQVVMKLWLRKILNNIRGTLIIFEGGQIKKKSKTIGKKNNIQT